MSHTVSGARTGEDQLPEGQSTVIWDGLLLRGQKSTAVRKHDSHGSGSVGLLVHIVTGRQEHRGQGCWGSVHSLLFSEINGSSVEDSAAHIQSRSSLPS